MGSNVIAIIILYDCMRVCGGGDGGSKKFRELVRGSGLIPWSQNTEGVVYQRLRKYLKRFLVVSCLSLQQR
jgi:hypothetical protein